MTDLDVDGADGDRAGARADGADEVEGASGADGADAADGTDSADGADAVDTDGADAVDTDGAAGTTDGGESDGRDAERGTFEQIRAIINDLGRRTERLETTVDELETKLTEIESAPEERTEGVDASDRIEELRDRVVRIHRELERKAPSDHEHRDLEEAIDALGTTVEQIERDLDEVTESVNGFEGTITELDGSVSELDATVHGIDDAIDEINEEREEVRGKLSKVASAIVRTQKRLKPVERHVADQRRLAEVKATANRAGVGKANCEACENTVRLGLLGDPTCPHCEERFRNLEPNTGFFGTSTLKTGDPPALDGTVAEQDLTAPDGVTDGSDR